MALRQQRIGAAGFLAKRALQLDPSHEKSTCVYITMVLFRLMIFCLINDDFLMINDKSDAFMLNNDDFLFEN